MALLNPLVWQGLYKVGKALVDLIKLDQHVKRVCKVRERPRGDEKKVKQKEVGLNYSKINVSRFVFSNS